VKVQKTVRCTIKTGLYHPSIFTVFFKFWTVWTVKYDSLYGSVWRFGACSRSSLCTPPGIAPPPATPCIAQAPVASPLCHAKLQGPRDASGWQEWPHLHARMHLHAVFPPCFTLATPRCCHRNSCLCMCGQAYAEAWCGGSPQALGRACQATWGGQARPRQGLPRSFPLFLHQYFV